MNSVQLPAQFLRVPHGGHRPVFRLPEGHIRVGLQQGGPVVLHMGGQLGPDGLVVRVKPDVLAHVVAELGDGAAGDLGRGDHARAGAAPARMALTVRENSTHSSFFSSSRRRPFFVTW